MQSTRDKGHELQVDMRTKRTIVLLAVALGVLLSRDALAFYNPSTGRWLTRDPIADGGGAVNRSAFYTARKGRPDSSRGDLNLLVTAGNQLVTRYDYLGLDYLDSCCPELYLWTSCEQVCRMAWRDLTINRFLRETGGTVVCYHGKACGCLGTMDSLGYYPGECPQIDETVQTHEDNHAKKAKCRSCGLHVANYNTEFPGVDVVQEECEQRKLHIQRLMALRGYLDTKCERVASALIGYLEKITANCP